MSETSLATIIICSQFKPKDILDCLYNLGEIHFVFKNQEDVINSIGREELHNLKLEEKFATATIRGVNCKLHFGEVNTKEIKADYYMLVYADFNIWFPDDVYSRISDKIYVGCYGDFIINGKYQYQKEPYPPVYIVKSESFNKFGQDLHKNGLFLKIKGVCSCSIQTLQ